MTAVNLGRLPGQLHPPPGAPGPEPPNPVAS